jgi:hypothetical protein
MNEAESPALPPLPDDAVRLQAEPALLHLTVTVTRKATGKVDTYQLVGTVVDDNDDEAR